MNFAFPLSDIWLYTFLGIACYGILAFVALKKWRTSLVKDPREGLLRATMLAKGTQPEPLIQQSNFSPLTDLTRSNDPYLYDDEEDEIIVEAVDPDENILLKEAERAVEEIQDVFDHVASNPPNPEEVYTKVRAVVHEYLLFENTQYYDAINSFISITAEREFGIVYNAEELAMLWPSGLN